MSGASRWADLATAVGAAIKGLRTAGETVPLGGTTGQVLTKDSGANGDTSWQTPGSTDSVFSDLASFFVDRQGSIALPNGAALTTLTSLGMPTPTNIGTASTGSPDPTGNAQRQSRHMVFAVSPASTTAIAGWRQSSQRWNRTQGFTVEQRWGPATGVATTTTRCFVGLRSVATAPTDVEISSLTTVHLLGFGWDAADANIQFFTSAGGGAPAKINTGIPVPTVDRSTWFVTKIWAAPGASVVNFSITEKVNNVSFSGDTGANPVPTANNQLAEGGWISVGGTSSIIGMAYGGTVIYA